MALGSNPILGSFTVDGLTFAVGAGNNLMLVAVDAAALAVAANDSAVDSAPDTAGVFLDIPESVVYDGAEYLVDAIAPYAFYLSGATSVSIPSSVTSIDDRAFRSCSVAQIDVADGNSTYSSFDGVLYDATQSRLLLVPGGRGGAVRFSDNAASFDALAFSHCTGVTEITASAGCPHFASWDGSLYTKDLSTLLRVPPGAVDLNIADGCTTIAAGALEGCVQLESITAPASVTSVSLDAFAAVPTVSLLASALVGDAADAGEKATVDEGGEGAAGDPSEASAPQLTAMVALTSADDEGPAVDPAAIALTLVEGADAAPWEHAGFAVAEWVTAAALPTEAPSADVQSASTYAAKYTINYLGLCDAMWWMQTGTGDYANYPWATNSHANEWAAFVPTFNSYRFYNGNLYMKVDPVNGSGRVIRIATSSSGGKWSYAKVATSKEGPYTAITPSSSYTTLTSECYIVLWSTYYSTTLDKQSGTGGTNSPVEVEPYGSMPTVTKPTLSGWTFSGYTDGFGTAPYLYTKADGTPTTRIITSNNKTLRANWTKTVTFNANGGTQGSLKTLTALKGQSLGRVCTQVSSSSADYPIRSLFQTSLKPDANWAPTRTGYVFDGFWSTSAQTGGTQWIDAEGNLKVATCPSSTPSTLYARWIQQQVTVDPNGGTVSDPSGSLGEQAVTVPWQGSWTAFGPPSGNSGRVYYGQQPTGAITWLRVTRAGYTFSGWDGIELNDSGEAYSTGRGPQTTLKALWSPRSITITWYANHDEAAISQGSRPVSDASITRPYDPASTLLETFGTPGFYQTPPGFAFAGWYSASGEGEGELLDADTPFPTTNKEYFAHWVPAVSADVPVEAEVRLDLLGQEEQSMTTGKEGWIESRSSGALEVVEVAFTPLSGAAALFGGHLAEVSLEAAAEGSAGADVSFALDAAATESDASKLAAFALPDGYGTRVGIGYRFAMPDGLVSSIDPSRFEGISTPVGQVVYTVALAE